MSLTLVGLIKIFAWADGKLDELAEQVGKLWNIINQSKPNQGPGPVGTPCNGVASAPSYGLSYLRLNFQVFVYKAFYESGNACAVEDSTRDFRWLTWEPFAETLPDNVSKCVEQTICDET